MTGFNGLAVPGPTNLPFPIRQAMDVALEDHRAPDFPEFTLPLLADLKRIFRTTTGQVFVFPSSGTGGWESAIANTLSPGDRVLAAVFGQFSHLWVDLCRRFGLDVEVVEVAWGEGVPLDAYEQRLRSDTAHTIKAVLACHNETATGVTSDVAGVRCALDAAGHPALLMVDGVSSIGCIEFNMDTWGVDVAVCGSQKGFMMPTGLAIVAVGQKALEARQTAKLPRCFFDYADMIKANKDGYFPYTPAATLLRGLRASVDMLEAEGLDEIFARHRRLATGVRAAVGTQALCQAPQMVLRHGERGRRTRRGRRECGHQECLLHLQPVARLRAVEGRRQGFPYRSPGLRERADGAVVDRRRRNGAARFRSRDKGGIGRRRRD
jgi:alanine-glyoxylate transaminase / serine-glyoxylate transaminase / serine-pyruvate transaminase